RERPQLPQIRRRRAPASEPRVDRQLGAREWETVERLADDAPACPRRAREVEAIHPVGSRVREQLTEQATRERIRRGSRALRLRTALAAQAPQLGGGGVALLEGWTRVL